MISFNKLCKLLPAFTCARAIGNLWSIYLVVNILSPVLLDALSFPSDTIEEWSSKNSITLFLAL